MRKRMYLDFYILKSQQQFETKNCFTMEYLSSYIYSVLRLFKDASNNSKWKEGGGI